MSGPKAPCLNCEHRQYNCHSICPVYQDYLKKRQAYKNQLFNAYYVEWDHNEHVFQTKAKMAKLRNHAKKYNV